MTFQDEQRRDRRIDFAICKRIFIESWGSSQINDFRRAAFVKAIEPHVKSVLRFWMRPASRFICLLIWEFFDINFGSRDWIKKELKIK